MGDAVYDRIGVGYSAVRRPDPRIEARIRGALGTVASVLNVGAGTGSYEPTDVRVVAVEPSVEMIQQRRPGAAPVVRASAERLPFDEASFDGAMAILTVHHWSDPLVGLAELRRVTVGPIVVLTFDKPVHDGMWLDDYLPEALELDLDLLDSSAIAAALGGGRVEVVPVPHDCIDGFAHANWRRPERYLDPAVRAGISTFARLPDSVVLPAMDRLRADLESGGWADEHADLLDRDEIDAGYRLVVVDRGARAAS
jgi:SAM-dependent methyltransferase